MTQSRPAVPEARSASVGPDEHKPPQPQPPPTPERIDIPMDYAVVHVPVTDQLAAQAPPVPAAAEGGGEAVVTPLKPGDNKPLPPKWFPPNSAYVSRMPNGYIVENAALRNGV